MRKIPVLTLDQIVVSTATFVFNIMYFNALTFNEIGLYTVIQVVMFLTQSFSSQYILVNLGQQLHHKNAQQILSWIFTSSILYSIPGLLTVVCISVWSKFDFQLLIWGCLIPVYTFYDVIRRQIGHTYSAMKSFLTNFFSGWVLFFLIVFQGRTTDKDSYLILFSLLIYYLSYLLIFLRPSIIAHIFDKQSVHHYVRTYFRAGQDTAFTIFATSIPFFLLPIASIAMSGQYRLALIYCTSIVTTLQSVSLNIIFFESSPQQWSSLQKKILFYFLLAYLLNFALYHVASIFLILRDIDWRILLTAIIVSYANFCLSLMKLIKIKQSSYESTTLFVFWVLLLITNSFPLAIYSIIDS